MMRASRWIIAALLAAGGWATLGWCDEPAHPAPGSPDVVDQFIGENHIPPAIEKLGRGVTNVAGGWLEIPLNIGKRYVPADAGTSLVVGAVYGLVKGVFRTGVGVYEAVTFFLPIPENFAPILPTLEYFKRTPKRERLPLE